MLEREISAWNAVDVRGNGGVIQRGHVIDKTDSGLWIDFRVPNKTPEFHPYKKVFSVSTAPETVLNDRAKYVLHQLAADQPWTWFPAKTIREVSSSKFILAEFDKNGVRVQDVFPIRFVRSFLPQPYQHLKADVFVKISVPFPKGFTAGVSFQGLWKNLPFALLLEIGNGGFTYLTMKFLSMYQNTFRNFMFKKAAEVQSKYLTEFFPDSAMRSIDDIHIHEIPFDILTETFSSMDATDSTRLRRVCHNWNWIILSSNCSRIVKMDLRTVKVSSGKFGACLYKSLRFVKILVLIGDSSTARNVCLYRPAAKIIKKILDIAGIKLSMIVLANLRISGELLVNPGDFIVTKPLRSCCSRLALKNVTVEYPLGYMFRRYGDVFLDEQQFDVDRCVVRTDSAVGVRDVYEANFPPMTALISLAHLSAVFFQAHNKPEKRFLKILRKWEFDDERFGPKCSWKHVQAAQLDKPDNLQTLRKTTLWLLVNSDQWQF